MQSELIEYFRFGDTDTHVLAPGNRYILAQKDLPVREVEMRQRQMDLMERLGKAFRYNTAVTAADKQQYTKECSDLVKSVMADMGSIGARSCQLDLVLNASELGLLPFELLLDENSVPYFADADRQWVLTRRIRQHSFEKSFVWPIKPRVLFAYSHGGGREVPFTHHLNELDAALRKWGGTNNADVFTLLAGASFEEIEQALQESDKGKYYTHVHILAHGQRTGEELYEMEYGVALGKAVFNVAVTAQWKRLFESLVHKPLLVNYMICDGANFSNPLKPDKNPVQVTHKAGVPIVLGSQFPLSMDGSTLITGKLFRALFSGEDIRTTLHAIRVALYKKGTAYHDWISLVCYLRLPEGYTDLLFKNALAYEMQDLRYIKSVTDQFLGKDRIDQDDFLNRLGELRACISRLEGRLEVLTQSGKFENELLENLGLLGSSYKRIAELFYIKANINRSITDEEKAQQQEALRKSLEYYKQASERNLNHHWTLVQYLSLDTVLHASISDKDTWFAARKAVNISLMNSPDSWAYGSLIELLLLDPKPQPGHKASIMQAVQDLVEASLKKEDTFPIESSWYQLNRYKAWWISENGFAVDAQLLVNDTELLEKILTILADVMAKDAGK